LACFKRTPRETSQPPKEEIKIDVQYSIYHLETEKTDSIIYRHQCILGITPEQIVQMGITLITEEKPLFPDMTVIENLKIGSHVERAKRNRQQSSELVYKIFPALAEGKNQMVRTLSGVEAKMLAIGKALISVPELLFVHKPCLGLAPWLAAKTFEAIQEIRKEHVTVVSVEQNGVFSMEISDGGKNWKTERL